MGLAGPQCSARSCSGLLCCWCQTAARSCQRCPAGCEQAGPVQRPWSFHTHSGNPLDRIPAALPRKHLPRLSGNHIGMSPVQNRWTFKSRGCCRPAPGSLPQDVSASLPTASDSLPPTWQENSSPCPPSPASWPCVLVWAFLQSIRCLSSASGCEPTAGRGPHTRRRAGPRGGSAGLQAPLQP